MGQAAKPICEFCKQPDHVQQFTVYGAIVFLHRWCLGRYRKFMEPKATPT